MAVFGFVLAANLTGKRISASVKLYLLAVYVAIQASVRAVNYVFSGIVIPIITSDKRLPLLCRTRVVKCNQRLAIVSKPVTRKVDGSVYIKRLKLVATEKYVVAISC